LPHTECTLINRHAANPQMNVDTSHAPTCSYSQHMLIHGAVFLGHSFDAALGEALQSKQLTASSGVLAELRSQLFYYTGWYPDRIRSPVILLSLSRNVAAHCAHVTSLQPCCCGLVKTPAPALPKLLTGPSCVPRRSVSSSAWRPGHRVARDQASLA